MNAKFLNSEHTELILKYTESKQGNKPTVKKIRNHLVKSENIDLIGDTSIKKFLK